MMGQRVCCHSDIGIERKEGLGMSVTEILRFNWHYILKGGDFFCVYIYKILLLPVLLLNCML